MAVQRFETMLLLKTDLFLAHNFLFLVFLAFERTYLKSVGDNNSV